MSASRTVTGSEFVIERVLDAPRDLVFRAWTEAEHLRRWWGPKGSEVTSVRMEPWPGGTFLFSLRTFDGSVLWGKWVFREVVPPERLVFVSSFSDPEATVAPVPFDANFPLEVHSVVTFADEGGKTRLTMRQIPLNATDAQRETFEALFPSMEQGWGGTLEVLAEYLAKWGGPFFQ